ncbi:MAG: hypothetical protein ACT4QF_08700 [Sporichthyaceae bacterium]
MKPDSLRRRAPQVGVAVLLLALVGCGKVADSEAVLPRVPAAVPSAAAIESTGSPAATPSQAPFAAATKPPKLVESPVPLAPVRAPTEFVGSDEDFVREVRENLEEEKVKSELSDSRLLKLGREFCSVLSGGGLLTDKVDYWAGLRELDKGSDAAIILAAQEVFCGELTDGYTRLELGEALTEPSPAEKADLARFVTALDEPDLAEKLKAMSDEQLAADAKRACGIGFHDEWWNRNTAKKVASELPDGNEMDYVVGLVTAYCPKEADDMIESLRDFAD